MANQADHVPKLTPPKPGQPAPRAQWMLNLGLHKHGPIEHSNAGLIVMVVAGLVAFGFGVWGQR
jgi:hypothetical protein